jgi:hypothetical protein
MQSAGCSLRVIERGRHSECRSQSGVFGLLQQECFGREFVASSRIWGLLDLAMEAGHGMLPVEPWKEWQQERSRSLSRASSSVNGAKEQGCGLRNRTLTLGELPRQGYQLGSPAESLFAITRLEATCL